MSTTTLRGVTAILEAEPLYEVTCSLCCRQVFRDAYHREFVSVYDCGSRPFARCAGCAHNLDQADQKARRLMAALLAVRYSLDRQRETFVDVYQLGQRLQGAIELSRDPGRAGPRPKLARCFAVGVFFHHGFTAAEIRPLLEHALGHSVGARYVERLIAESPLPINRKLRDYEPQRDLALPV